MVINKEGGWLADVLFEVMHELSEPYGLLCCSADTTYSALVEDWDTLDCSLELQEMGLPASRKTALETEQQVLGCIA